MLRWSLVALYLMLMYYNSAAYKMQHHWRCSHRSVRFVKFFLQLFSLLKFRCNLQTYVPICSPTSPQISNVFYCSCQLLLVLLHFRAFVCAVDPTLFITFIFRFLNNLTQFFCRLFTLRCLAYLLNPSFTAGHI